MKAPNKCNAAVFVAPNEPLQFREFPLPEALPDGAVLCRLLLSTICGSDLHTVCGRRTEPTPSILGHESVGAVVAVGKGAHYWDGTPLKIGERVSWTIMASCGNCYFCKKNLPQKCEHLIKYGHSPLSLFPGITGGYAEYIYLFPGTGIFPLPEGLDNAIVVPANCALATAVCATETIGGITPGESVLIFGAGLLGTYLAALCKESGANPVLVVDINTTRSKTVLAFGANISYSDGADSVSIIEWARHNYKNKKGIDVVFEACGNPQAVTTAIKALRIGGKLMISGLVTPESNILLDGNEITRKYLTVSGIHNYHPVHLGKALKFLQSTIHKYPFHQLVGQIVDLTDINHAFELAKQGKFRRVGVKCR